VSWYFRSNGKHVSKGHDARRIGSPSIISKVNTTTFESGFMVQPFFGNVTVGENAVGKGTYCFAHGKKLARAFDGECQ